MAASRPQPARNQVHAPATPKMDGATRFTIMRKFNDRNQDGPRVLILTYTISSAGVNFQGECRNSHHFTKPPSQSQNDQAIKGRLRRIGQTRTIKIYSYVLENSHDMYMASKFTYQCPPRKKERKTKTKTLAIEYPLDGGLLFEK